MTESNEIKSLKSENFENKNAQVELDNIKIKFQNLLDSADLKKADEVLSKIITILLADLSLKISEDSEKDLNEGKKICIENQSKEKKTEKNISIPEEEKPAENIKNLEIKTPQFKNSGQFKAAEFLIEEAENNSELYKSLDKLVVKRIDNLLLNSKKLSMEQSKIYFGSYRGSILGEDKKIFGTLVMSIDQGPNNDVKGSISIFKNGSEVNGSQFTSPSIGYEPNESKATIISVAGTHSLQVYRIEKLNKLAGIYYERLPNGTTKMIGKFILMRTDI